MAKSKVRIVERLESYVIPLIQQEGADRNVVGFWPKALLTLLKGISKIYGGVVWLRMWFFRIGVLRRWPLGCQVISVGNVTAGGTGKTPVVEIFARELTRQGRKVAILSRGYRRKEKPFLQRLFSDTIEPPLVVSDGRRVLLDSETGGDEPYMLASNLPGVVVLVDRNRVKSGRYAVRKFGCDTLVLDDGFQYQRLKHSHDIVLVDKTNPFGNGHLLPRGVLREGVQNPRISGGFGIPFRDRPHGLSAGPYRNEIAVAQESPAANIDGGDHFRGFDAEFEQPPGVEVGSHGLASPQRSVDQPVDGRGSAVALDDEPHPFRFEAFDRIAPFVECRAVPLEPAGIGELPEPRLQSGIFQIDDYFHVGFGFRQR